MIRLSAFMIICSLFMVVSCNGPEQNPDDFWKLANNKKETLRLSTYVTAHTVEQMFSTFEGRREVLSLLRCYGITKVYLEVYRSGLVIGPELIEPSVKFLEDNGFEVVGGIATVPGNNFGLRQEGPLGWFNWQNQKTQDDLRRVIEDSAPFFQSFIIDDFLCTSDTSLESKAAKGDMSWSEYRRMLLTDLSESIFIKPAKMKNPAIRMIIKYPQWYDRFHIFGYDVAAKTELFDGIWVGTESRGQYTQRFGFVQPYEGFINLRWLNSIAGSKSGGSWFDHIDCTDRDFLEQAYQSVLAGSRELIIFSFDSFISGHPGHHLLIQDFEKLVSLAEKIASGPVQGPAGYKPPNSDAGGDLYLFDYIGMLGISLIPESSYPGYDKVIFLPTQAAADEEISSRVAESLRGGSKIIMTAGFLAKAKDGDKLAQFAQVKWPLTEMKSEIESIELKDSIFKLAVPLKTDYRLVPGGACVLLKSSENSNNPYLICNKEKNIYVINTHTFSQEDFEAVGEHLLAPRPLGLVELPREWVNIIRDAFHQEGDPVIDAPARVSVQKLADGSLVIHNYNQQTTDISITFSDERDSFDGFTGLSLPSGGNEVKLTMKARTNFWLKRDGS
ncbi:MAG TPA: hypothetical protein VMV47_16420 [Bacteroidales bacterium]|nr:hypothetical protein [Bacteroidales bacterium]